MTISDTSPDESLTQADPVSPKRPGLNTETLALGGLFVAIFAFAAAVFAVSLASRAADEHRALARSAGGPTTPAAQVATVALAEFSITPGDLTVAAGTKVTVRNDGTIVHNLSVDGTGTPMLNGGESSELDLSTLAPGTYNMRCDVPGHEAAGMKGTLTVE